MASGQSLGSPAGLPLQGTGAQWDMGSAQYCMGVLREGTTSGSGPCCQGGFCVHRSQVCRNGQHISTKDFWQGGKWSWGD